MTNAGGILATWLLGTLSHAPGYRAAGVTFLVFQVGILVCAQANLAKLNLPYPRALFELNYFRFNPIPCTSP